MPRTTAQILADIESFRPIGDQWKGLEALLEELWDDGNPAEGIEVLLRVFERFPEHDGYGVFGTILHGIEGLDGYEPHLIRAVRRAPTEFSLRLVARLINGGTDEIDGVSLRGLLEEVASGERYLADARDWARTLLEELRRVRRSGP